MPIFNIIFKDNTSKEIAAENKDALIRDFCSVDATAFQEDVKEIRWEEQDFCCIETISSGKIKKIAVAE